MDLLHEASRGGSIIQTFYGNLLPLMIFKGGVGSGPPVPPLDLPMLR